MRKILVSVLGVLAILVGVVAVTQPAQAASTETASAQVVIPPDVQNPLKKFWTPNVCIDGSAINGAYYRVGYLAQQWNLRAPLMGLDYSDDCAADGYSPSERMVVGTFNNPADNHCWLLTNQQTAYLNGAYRWTNGPGIYINIGIPSCVSSQTRRDHAVSFAIGFVLGLNQLNSTGYNSRVMNQTAFSWDNVPLPDQNSGNTLGAIYAYAYCDPFGTTC